jgi:hypothetical protein
MPLGASVTPLVEHGAPGPAVVSVEAAGALAGVAMGLRGSVCHHVVRRSEVSLLVVRKSGSVGRSIDAVDLVPGQVGKCPPASAPCPHILRH